ncbi:SET domain containing protein [Aphelenchoides avenae]|nr:SET domain containing protein [Aphelenchus avenae]
MPKKCHLLPDALSYLFYNCLDATKCKCQQESAVYDGRIRKEPESTDDDENRECNHTCACRRKQVFAGTPSEEHDVAQEPVETCVNRVAQNPLNIPLEVYQTAEQGWAVRSRVWLPPGRHVSNYTAPYLSERLAASSARKDSVYLMDVDYSKDGASKRSGQPMSPRMFVIDGKFGGNVGRFFSHSCRPNMTSHSVYTDTHDVRLPVIALFTHKVVEPGEPLTYHYGPDYVEKNKRTRHCNDGRIVPVRL